jgi:hypothetical protein
MGCWNGTCGISQMSINAGDPVKVIMIQNQIYVGEAAGYCYPTGNALPISFAFDAVYDDYGSFEDMNNGLGFKLFEEYFNHQLNVRDGIRITADAFGDKHLGIPEHDHSNLTSKQIIGLIERDRVLTKDAYGDKDGVLMGFMFIHKDIYDSVIRTNQHIHDMCSKELTERSTSWRYEYNGHSVFNSMSNVNTHAFEYYFELYSQNQDQYDLSEFAELMSEFVSITKAMDMLRKSWGGQSGKGSQSCDFEYTKRLIDGMQRLIKRYEDEYNHINEE